MSQLKHPQVSEGTRSRYLSSDQVTELVPGVTKTQLAQWRYLGKGPKYRKVGKTVVYLEEEVIAWVESTARQGTALEAV